MSPSESFRNKPFLVTDPDARIRRAGKLLDFEVYGAGDQLPLGRKVGDFKTIPAGQSVRVDAVEVVPIGGSRVIVFCRAIPSNGGPPFGWTSTRNFRGQFVNETLGVSAPAPGANKYGPNAAWSAGAYVGQRTLVAVVDSKLEVERIASDTLEPYLALVRAAEQDGQLVALNSGFRSYPEQKYLHDGYVKKLPGFNKAAPPGTSQHQNGKAFDLAVAGGDGNPVYEWLKRHAPARGFLRTVNGEPWHWEHDPPAAAKAVAAGTYKTKAVKV